MGIESLLSLPEPLAWVYEGWTSKRGQSRYQKFRYAGSTLLEPTRLKYLQALAAIGQCRLLSLWDSLFAHLRQPVAQILLTRSDIADVCRLKQTLHST